MDFPFFSLAYLLADPIKGASQKALLYNLLSPLGKAAASPACDVLSNINMAIVSCVVASHFKNNDNSISYPIGKLCQ